MKIDHIALQVSNIYEGCEWYCTLFNANVLYFDETWAILEFDNVKLALMLPGTHPNHLAIEVDPNRYPKLDFKQHRDGSNYHYLTDPWGNYVELINYGHDLDENT